MPIPFPTYVPTPMMMYNAPTPVPLMIPIPIPIPVFIPTTEKTTKNIQDKIEVYYHFIFIEKTLIYLYEFLGTT